MSTDCGSTLFKPATYKDAIGMKVASVRNNNPKVGLPAVPATIIMVDKESGVCNSVMDATVLTAMRTAAGSASVARVLADPSSSELIVFGTGPQALYHVLCLLTPHCGFPIKTLTIVYHTFASGIRLIDELNTHELFRSRGLAVRLVSASRDGDAHDHAAAQAKAATLLPASQFHAVLGQADLVCLATSSPVPVLPGAALKPGAMLMGVGAYLPDTREADDDCIRRAHLVLDCEGARRCGEVALASPPVGDAGYTLAGAVLTAAAASGPRGGAMRGALATAGDESRDVVFFKSIGVAVQDVATAKYVLERRAEMQE
eukprot:TRINITY_DN43104_c0_g1_i1.p1 TRINITY_DN43104_c0_g1~~TRINITY_DN43104_c0_g1_i1.p1  ORF type:complete len:361 (-),score=-17.53 TRINITY_DN43104_c0_g1_i1:30-977(-)